MALKELAMALIGLYQRRLSPHKGFGCAYRVHTGRASCSALGLRAIRRHGLTGGPWLLDRRLARCGLVHRRAGPRRPRWRSQAGVCDVGDVCNPCDLVSADTASSCCDVCGGCDWPWRSREAKRTDPKDGADARVRTPQRRKPPARRGEAEVSP